jgi:hypothetical protein
MRVFVLCALIATVATTGCGKKEDPQQAKADPMKGIVVGDPKPEPPPPPPPPPDQFKGKGNPPPKGLVQSVRAAAYRPERQNDLRTIGQFFNQYVLNFNRNPKTDEEFLKFFERDAPVVAKAVRDGLYALNLNAKSLSSNSVIAYETLLDQGGYQAVRGDNSVEAIPEAELRKMTMP